MAYATVTRGYKGPFINDQASYPITGPQLVVKPEYPTDVELGFKTEVRNNLYVDVSLFYDKTKGFQTTVYTPPSSANAVSSFINGNADYALTYGIDVAMTGNVTSDLSFNADLIYNKANFNKGFQVPCDAVGGTCEAVSQLPYAPKFKATISGEYRHN